MTQKDNLFKGKQTKKSIPANRHGKAERIRKGKKVAKPTKVTKDMETDRELTKFINFCNESKAATSANKDGGQLSIVKPESSTGKKVVKPTEVTKVKETDCKELAMFINFCNESEAATAASKDGGN